MNPDDEISFDEKKRPVPSVDFDFSVLDPLPAAEREAAIRAVENCKIATAMMWHGHAFLSIGHADAHRVRLETLQVWFGWQSVAAAAEKAKVARSTIARTLEKLKTHQKIYAEQNGWKIRGLTC